MFAYIFWYISFIWFSLGINLVYITLLYIFQWNIYFSLAFVPFWRANQLAPFSLPFSPLLSSFLFSLRCFLTPVYPLSLHFHIHSLLSFPCSSIPLYATYPSFLSHCAYTFCLANTLTYSLCLCICPSHFSLSLWLSLYVDSFYLFWSMSLHLSSTHIYFTNCGTVCLYCLWNVLSLVSSICTQNYFICLFNYFKFVDNF